MAQSVCECCCVCVCLWCNGLFVTPAESNGSLLSARNISILACLLSYFPPSPDVSCCAYTSPQSYIGSAVFHFWTSRCDIVLASNNTLHHHFYLVLKYSFPKTMCFYRHIVFFLWECEGYSTCKGRTFYRQADSKVIKHCSLRHSLLRNISMH